MEDVEDDESDGRSVIPAHVAGLESCPNVGDSVLEIFGFHRSSSRSA